LLLDVDVPWEADGVRDSGARRERLHGEFLDTLHDFGARVVTISGSGWDERVARALAVLETIYSVEDGQSPPSAREPTS
jgi:nicotinamide riboside kinase